MWSIAVVLAVEPEVVELDAVVAVVTVVLVVEPEVVELNAVVASAAVMLVGPALKADDSTNSGRVAEREYPA
jgi:hypothetical protein